MDPICDEPGMVWDGERFVPCPACNGTGIRHQLSDVQGITVTCHLCSGTGQFDGNWFCPCRFCTSLKENQDAPADPTGT